MTILGRFFDERFFAHRRRSTSTAGVISVNVTALLFAYRFYIGGSWSWDLFAIIATFLVVKLTLMTWYFLRD